MGFSFSSTGGKPVKKFIEAALGAAEVTQNDLVQIAERGKIWPVEHKYYAGLKFSGVDNSLDLSSSSTQVLTNFQDLVFNKTNYNTYVMEPIAHDGSAPQGMTIERFDQSMQPVNEIILLASNIATEKAILQELSDGNLLAVWKSSSVYYFGIYNQALGQVVAQTSLGSQNSIAVKALVGGGFAVATINASDALSLAIYANDGSAVMAATSIDAAVGDVTIDQLSNGNIVVLTRPAANTSLCFATYSNTGTPVITKTALIPFGPSESGSRLSLSVISGYFCILHEKANQISMMVISNAGQTRNYIASYPFVGTLSGSGTARNALLLNNEAGFWVLTGLSLQGPATDRFVAHYLPTTGNNTDNKEYVYPFSIFKIPGYDGGPNIGDTDVSGFYKNGVIIFNYENSQLALNVSGDQITNVVNNYFNGNFIGKITPTFDGAYVACGSSSNDNLKVILTKYIETAILGVSLKSVAAGNEDSLLPIDMTEGSHHINPCLGGYVEFDHETNMDIYTGIQGKLFTGTILIGALSGNQP